MCHFNSKITLEKVVSGKVETADWDYKQEDCEEEQFQENANNRAKWSRS